MKEETMMEKLDKLAVINPGIYLERVTDIQCDVAIIYSQAITGSISWKKACEQLQKTNEFYGTRL